MYLSVTKETGFNKGNKEIILDPITKVTVARAFSFMVSNKKEMQQLWVRVTDIHTHTI
jgi:hypothetical protein